MLSKKSIVLSDLNLSSNKKAVLTMEKQKDDVVGTMRLYNFPLEVDGLLTLGFYVDGKVIKSGLTRKGNSLYSFLLSDDFIEKKFSCAVMEFKDAEVKPILFGSSEGREEDVYASIISSLSNDFSMKNVEKVLDENGVDYDEEEKEEIEKEIDKCLNGDCANCFYKSYFYENNKSNSLQNEVKKEEGEEVEMTPLNEKEDEKFINASDNSFLGKLRPQIEKLFEKNPVETNLEELIPSSKWVKIEYEDDGDFYVFGLLYEQGEVKYVCYGVPAIYEEEPPKELSGYPIFVPLNKEDKTGFGYWLTYQDAETGEPVRATLG